MNNTTLHALEAELQQRLSVWLNSIVAEYEGRLPYHLIIYSIDTVVNDAKKRILRREAERRAAARSEYYACMNP